MAVHLIHIFQTLNHRRLVRQLYEQSTLQNLLGLPRYQPTPVTAARETVTSRSRLSVGSKHLSASRSAKVVESAWGEADMDLAYSDEELVASHLPSPGAEDESRYSNRHARKRRRLGTVDTNGKRQDAIFVADSEEEEGLVISPVDHHSSEESGAGTVEPGVNDARNGRLEARRAYWASKGMSGGGLEDSD
jgi:hypothetical protein